MKVMESWDDCDLVERVPGKMSGQPVIKGTRVLAQTIVDNFDGGSTVEEIHENYPHIPVESIRSIIAFQTKRRSSDRNDVWRRRPLIIAILADRR